jgi:glycosyltransferase involved in cell wall biosynthesis
MMLYKLLEATDRIRFEPMVVVMMDRGALGLLIEDLGIPVYAIGMDRGHLSLTHFWHLVKLIRQLQPDIIQGWTYHANLAATFATWMLSIQMPVMWSIHHSLNDLASEKPLTRILIQLGAWLSNAPTKIHYCAQVSADQHEAIGYLSHNRVVIPNGFDVAAFQPYPDARKTLRKALRIAEETVLIGTVARYHPMKDHANFIHAAKYLTKYWPDAHFVMVGRDVDFNNSTLVENARNTGLGERVHLLGERKDIAKILAGLDIFTTSSAWGESFPIVVGEAMSCGIPCVVTDLGDSAHIVGDTGIVVPPRNAEALADGWAKILELGPFERSKLGLQARERIIEHFSLSKVARQYEDLYTDVLKFTFDRTRDTQLLSEDQKG